MVHKLLSSAELEKEIDIAFLNNYGNIDEGSDVPRMYTAEILNKSILLLLDILHNQNVDIEQEVADRLTEHNDINNLIVFNILSDRVDYFNSESK